GPLQVISGGRELAIGSTQQRTLLAMLALRLNQVVPRDELIDELWGGCPPASATTSLHSLVSRLRGALAECASGTAGVVLETREPGYVLEGDPECVDAHRFAKLTARAREHIGRGAPEAAAQTLRQALGLWRGRALVDLADASFAHLEAER